MKRPHPRTVPALYAALVFAPAAVALAVDPFSDRRATVVELSVAFGFFAFSVILLQFALVSRLKSVSRRVGTDALVQLHQYAGLLAVLLLLLHAVLLHAAGLPWQAWNPFDGSLSLQAGAIGFWSVVAIALTSVGRRVLRLSYEVWRVLHVVLALSAAAALVTHVLAVNGYTSVRVLRVLLVTFAALAAVVTLGYVLVRPLRLFRIPWEVVSNRDEGASIRTVRLRPIGHTGFSFEPGQFAWLITGRSPFSLQQHPLSISSSADRPADGSIEFSIKALGDWSARVVPALQPGDRVWVDGPFGSFVPARGSLRPLVLVAGGIGIAPIRSMVTTLGDRREERHVILIYAAHDEGRVAFRQELDALRGLLHLRLVYVFEKPAPGWSGPSGYVTTELLRQTLGSEAVTAECFVCGPVPMMNAVEKALRAVGVPPDCIHSERFQVV